MRFVISALVLFSLWLLMSGVYKPLVVWLGAGSVLFVIFVVRRMDAQDGDRLRVSLHPIRTVGYILWLLKEIAKSNWAVSKVILSGKMPINQNLFRVSCTQHTDLGRTTFANSVTLTPGTISVEAYADHFMVHALSYSDGDLDDLAEMDRRVTAIEGQA